MLTRARRWWQAHFQRRRFGRGRRTLSDSELQAVAQGVQAGLSNSAISRCTRLNRRTVARLRAENNTLATIAADLGARGLRHGIVVGPQQDKGATAPVAERPTAAEAFRFKVMEQVLRAAVASARRHDPTWLLRWGDRIVRSLWPGPGDLVDQVAAEVAGSDAGFRRELADLGLQRLKADQPGGRTPAKPNPHAFERRVRTALKHRKNQDTATVKAVLGVAAAAVGPGGLLTEMARQPATEPGAPKPTQSQPRAKAAPRLLGLFTAEQLAALVDGPAESPVAITEWRRLEAAAAGISNRGLQRRALLVQCSELTPAAAAALFEELAQGHPSWAAFAERYRSAPDVFERFQERLRSLLKPPARNGDT